MHKLRFSHIRNNTRFSQDSLRIFAIALDIIWKIFQKNFAVKMQLKRAIRLGTRILSNFFVCQNNHSCFHFPLSKSGLSNFAQRELQFPFFSKQNNGLAF